MLCMTSRFKIGLSGACKEPLLGMLKLLMINLQCKHIALIGSRDSDRLAVLHNIEDITWIR